MLIAVLAVVLRLAMRGASKQWEAVSLSLCVYLLRFPLLAIVIIPLTMSIWEIKYSITYTNVSAVNIFFTGMEHFLDYESSSATLLSRWEGVYHVIVINNVSKKKQTFSGPPSKHLAA